MRDKESESRTIKETERKYRRWWKQGVENKKKKQVLKGGKGHMTNEVKSGVMNGEEPRMPKARRPRRMATEPRVTTKQ